MENAEASLVMDKKVYVAAMKGNVNLLKQTQSDEYLLRKTHEKNNILHIAIQSQQLEFIAATLRRFPQKGELICGENSQQNTPLHVAAEAGNIDVVGLIYDGLENMVEGDDDDKPWRLKNSKGNTPAHEALLQGKVAVAMFLFNRDPRLAFIVNESKEALLHLAVKHHTNYSESDSLKAKIKEGEVTSAINFEPGENMASMIEILVEKACCVTCWRDINGLTPLHSATSLSIPYNLQIIRLVIEHWPQSTEVCDNSGKSILHLLINRIPNYQEGKNLLNIGEIYKLRNCQDHQGNTALHIAASNMDIDMVRVLLEFGSNLDINNMKGISATNIIQQNGIVQMLQKRGMKKEESDAANRGDIHFLSERMLTVGDDFFRSQDSDGKNFLHILFNVRHEDIIMQPDQFYDFIEQAICDPTLLCQTDKPNGDTPIHVLARRSNIQLLTYCDLILSIQQERITDVYIMQNAAGNTPLHEALMSSNDALKVMYDDRYMPERTAVRLLHYHNELVYRLKDQHRWIGKESTDVDIPPYYKYVFFGFLTVGDIKGNTVLHLAIQNKQFYFIHSMFDFYEDDPGFPDLFETANKDGETPAYLIGEMETIPRGLEQRILRHPKLRGIRSTWGIPNKNSLNYISSMNVIAALITTITFTAAFTVPGGLNQETGTPILIERKAFRAFMALDVLAMCLSMMVLFCMLHIGYTDKRQSVMIQDFSLTLLVVSFIATLLTFIAGVYAIIDAVNSQLAKRILIGCCPLVLIVHKPVLVKLFLPLYFSLWKYIYRLYVSIKSFVIDLIVYVVRCYPSKLVGN